MEKLVGPVHSNGHYGPKVRRQLTNIKKPFIIDHMREWTNNEGISCFYFEAFDEIWKDAENPEGSENHFGLFTCRWKGKICLWDLVDNGIFKGLTRGGNVIIKDLWWSKTAGIAERSFDTTSINEKIQLNKKNIYA